MDHHPSQLLKYIRYSHITRGQYFEPFWIVEEISHGKGDQNTDSLVLKYRYIFTCYFVTPYKIHFQTQRGRLVPVKLMALWGIIILLIKKKWKNNKKWVISLKLEFIIIIYTGKSTYARPSNPAFTPPTFQTCLCSTNPLSRPNP